MKEHVRIAVLLFAWFFFLYTLTMAGHFFSQDGEILYRAAVSFYGGEGGAVEPLHGAGPVLGPDGQVYRVPIRAWGTRQGLDGRQYPQYGIGQPLLAVPLVGLGRLGSRLLPASLVRSFGHVYPLFQYHSRSWADFFRRCVVGRLNQLVSAVTVALLYLFLFRVWRRHLPAAGVAVAYGASTAAWVQSRTFFTEPLAGLCILLSYYFATASRDTPAGTRHHQAGSLAFRGAALAGLAFGYSLLTRLDSLLFLPGLALLLVYPTLEETGSPASLKDLATSLRSRNSWIRLTGFGLPVALFVAILAWMNLERFGSVFATGYSDQPEGIRFHLPFAGITGLLFSPGKSIFVYSPPVLLALFGWRRFLREHRPLALSVAVGVACFFLFEASWQNWEGGWCWGPRHIFQITALLMLSACALLVPSSVTWGGRKKAAVALVFALGFVVQAIGISADFVKAIGLLSPTEIPLTIYSPAYSHIALHLRMLLRGDHDLFVLHFIRSNPPAYWIVPFLVLAGLVVCGFLLARELRDAHRAPLR